MRSAMLGFNGLDTVIHARYAIDDRMIIGCDIATVGWSWRQQGPIVAGDASLGTVDKTLDTSMLVRVE